MQLCDEPGPAAALVWAARRNRGAHSPAPGLFARRAAGAMCCFVDMGRARGERAS